EALQNALNLAEEPERIECFDVSHIQGSDTVASMVVWEKGRMKKGDYRKFIIRGMDAPVVAGRTVTSSEGVGGIPGNGVRVLPVYRQNDDFASMREVVTRRYRREQEEKRAMPSLVL